ncbi:MAG: hypothetical protein NT167_20695, partial [Verrucomicrobia bacterium]|nr:hypothetical protein [Verrucomicrobiota bacterium]
MANPLGQPIGSQVWPLRSTLKDFPAFAQRISKIGVTRLELCSPIGYGAAFSSLADAKEVKQIMADHGLKSESSHFTMGELRHKQEKCIDWAKEIGITQMITASLGDAHLHDAIRAVNLGDDCDIRDVRRGDRIEDHRP